MIVYFLRHADAEDPIDSDFTRKLTAKGLEQSAKVGKFCVRNGLAPGAILSSPLVRARHTAEIVAKALGTEPEIVDWLACGLRPAVLFEKLAARKGLDSIMLVGHEPDIGNCVAALSGMKDSVGINIRKASLTAVDAPLFEPESGRLEFSVPVRLM
jgi:phosphohistidine phosphatase